MVGRGDVVPSGDEVVEDGRKLRTETSVEEVLQTGLMK